MASSCWLKQAIAPSLLTNDLQQTPHPNRIFMSSEAGWSASTPFCVGIGWKGTLNFVNIISINCWTLKSERIVWNRINLTMSGFQRISILLNSLDARCAEESDAAMLRYHMRFEVFSHVWMFCYTHSNYMASHRYEFSCVLSVQLQMCIRSYTRCNRTAFHRHDLRCASSARMQMQTPCYKQRMDTAANRVWPSVFSNCYLEQMISHTACIWMVFPQNEFSYDFSDCSTARNADHRRRMIMSFLRYDSRHACCIHSSKQTTCYTLDNWMVSHRYAVVHEFSSSSDFCIDDHSDCTEINSLRDRYERSGDELILDLYETLGCNDYIWMT